MKQLFIGISNKLSLFFQSIIRKTHWTLLLEILLITIWALIIGRNYLNFDPYTIPAGGDYAHEIYNHYVWNDFKECGGCALWNGTANGGSPSFADIQGATLHPLVIITTLGWGVINGSKMLILASMIMLGIGQWWLTLVMGVKQPIRIWAGLLVVASGSVASRMEGGLILIVFSAANALLILPPLVDFYLHRKRRSGVLVAIFLALTLISGQAYIQIGLLAAILPAALILFLKPSGQSKPVLKDFLLALGIGVLLAAVFWVPMVHFGGNFIKDGNPAFDTTDPLLLVPLNLVLPYNLPLFHNWPTGFRNYLGIIPLLLAFLSLRVIPKEKTRLLIFFWVATGILILIVSSDFMKFISQFWPNISLIRFPLNTLTLAIPLLIALAAWSLDHINTSTPAELSIKISDWSANISLVKIGILAIMAWVVIDNININSEYLYMRRLEVPEELIGSLKTEETAWIRVPNVNNDLSILVLENNLKFSGLYRPSWWKDHPLPPPFLEASDNPEDKNSPDKIETFNYGGYTLLTYPDNHYAAVISSDGSQTPCHATAKGGNIDVDCVVEQPGTLQVYENYWSGWYVSMDGQPAELTSSLWLETEAPAGEHHFEFRYRPWDVWIGLLISLVGIALATWYIRRKDSSLVSS